jgi:hypothetical protein
MFTGDRATAHQVPIPVVPPSRERVIEEPPTVCSCSATRRSSCCGCESTLGTDERILECGVEADGDRHMYIAREGGTDALTLHMAGRPAPWGA